MTTINARKVAYAIANAASQCGELSDMTRSGCAALSVHLGHQFPEVDWAKAFGSAFERVQDNLKQWQQSMDKAKLDSQLTTVMDK
jgi:hypothetical protein